MISGIYQALIDLKSPQSFEPTVVKGFRQDYEEAFIDLRHAEIKRTLSGRLLTGTCFEGVAKAPIDKTEGASILSDVSFKFTIASETGDVRDQLELRSLNGPKVKIDLRLQNSSPLRALLLKESEKIAPQISVDDSSIQSALANCKDPVVFNRFKAPGRNFAALIKWLGEDMQREFTTVALYRAGIFRQAYMLSCIGEILSPFFSTGLLERVGRAKYKLSSRGLITRDSLLAKQQTD